MPLDGLSRTEHKKPSQSPKSKLRAVLVIFLIVSFATVAVFTGTVIILDAIEDNGFDVDQGLLYALVSGVVIKLGAVLVVMFKYFF